MGSGLVEAEIGIRGWETYQFVVQIKGVGHSSIGTVLGGKLSRALRGQPHPRIGDLPGEPLLRTSSQTQVITGDAIEA